MTLTLTIENETSLPDGGPLSVTIQGKRGIDIGRDTHLDWTLPDPTRFISSKHCEVRYKDGGYWLHDVSTNGTFLYGTDHRMQAPHRLRNGDRFVIGTYIVAVALDGDGESAQSPGNPAPPSARPIDDTELWANEGEIAAPIDARELRPPKARRPAGADFLDWAVDIPDPISAPAAAQPDPYAGRPTRGAADAPANDRDMDWSAGRLSSAPAAAPAPPAMPTPRRPSSADHPSLWADSAPARAAPAASGGAPAPETAAPTSVARPPDRGIASPDAFLRQLAAAAGLPEDLFARADPADLAHQLGSVLRIVTENLMQLLQARAQSKQLARSTSHTMVQAVGNNPLKFAPSVEDALRIMFGPATQSYLDARRALEQGFADLKQHQIKTYAAMQHALAMLTADLGPHAIEQSAPDDRGLAALLASRKARFWDVYVARWDAKVRAGERGPIEAFLAHFAEYYDRDPNEAPRSGRPPEQPQFPGTDKDDVLAQ